MLYYKYIGKNRSSSESGKHNQQNGFPHKEPFPAGAGKGKAKKTIIKCRRAAERRIIMNNTTNNFETVEELVKRAHVTYAEAKDALEVCDWNLTEAFILLEKQGKLNSAAYNSAAGNTANTGNASNFGGAQNTADSGFNKESIKKTASECAESFRKVVDSGNKNYFEMMKDGKVYFSIPVTVAVIIGILGINLVVPFAIITLLLGFSFHITKKEDYVSASFNSYQPWTNGGSAENSSSSNINLEK